MGNSMTCFAPKASREKASKWSQNPLSFIESSGQKKDTTPRTSSSSAAVKKEVIDDDLLRQQAVAAVLLLKQHQQNGSSVPQFDRSSSVHYPLSSSKKQNKLPRSSSSRPSSAMDLSHTQLTKTQDSSIEDLETKHFLLVHGSGFGAWCWYKSMALLREAGFDVDAIDLTGSGADATDSNSITSFAQYVKPLVDFLENLSEGQKANTFCISLEISTKH